MKTNRVNRVLQEMEAQGLGQMVVTDPYSIFYLTGRWIFPGERMLALCLNVSGAHHLFLSSLYPQAADAEMELHFFTDFQDAVAMLAELLPADGTVGVDKTWAARFLLHLQELRPGVKFVNTSPIVDRVRMVKDAEEQALMRASSLTNDEAMRRLVALADKGLNEADAAQALLGIYRELGCEDVSFAPIIAYGANTADPHYMPRNAVAKRGDCITYDIGGKKDAYCSDMTRDVFLGEVSDRQREVYEIVLEANLRGIAAARPGNRMCDVDLAARDYIRSKGLGDFFPHRTGHSIGLEDHEFGDVSYSNEAVIVPGQIFSVEPGVYLPDEGFGVRVEDLVLITENGCEVLNKYPKELTVIPF